MKILVTGSLGVIGSFLSRQLRKEGHDVIGADLLLGDYDDYVRADVTSFEDLYRVFKAQSPDAVIHTAGEVGRMRGEEFPQKMLYVNDLGVLNLARLCIDYDCKLVNFSTSEVYGRLLDRRKPVTEEEIDRGSVFQTTNMYAMSKLFGEAIVKHYVENYGLNAVTVRPFMIYGPGEYPSKYRSALTNFVYQALTGKKITVHKGAVRAWCYITDFVDGISKVMRLPQSKDYEAYNLGSDEYHTMEDVATIVLEEAGANLGQLKMVNPPDQFMSLVKIASIAKAKSIGYKPQVTLREGVRNLVDWQRKEVVNG